MGSPGPSLVRIHELRAKYRCVKPLRVRKMCSSAQITNTNNVIKIMYGTFILFNQKNKPQIPGMEAVGEHQKGGLPTWAGLRAALAWGGG
jgi:hypothetical protein